MKRCERIVGGCMICNQTTHLDDRSHCCEPERAETRGIKTAVVWCRHCDPRDEGKMGWIDERNQLHAQRDKLRELLAEAIRVGRQDQGDAKWFALGVIEKEGGLS